MNFGILLLAIETKKFTCGDLTPANIITFFNQIIHVIRDITRQKVNKYDQKEKSKKLYLRTIYCTDLTYNSCETAKNAN